MAHTAVTHNELRDGFDAPEKYVGYKVLDPEARSVGRVEVIFTNVRD